MQQPDRDMRAFQSSPVSPRRFISLGLVGLLHVFVIYALASGLATSMVKKVTEDVQVKIMKETPPDLDKTPPPPPPDLAKPPPPFVPPPEISIQASTGPTSAIAAVQTKQPVATNIVPPRAIGRSHNCDSYYPPIAQRLGQSGVVVIQYSVGVDGSVTAASVDKSSGFDRLDDAALRCIQSRWRQHPATQGGKPIAITTKAAVRFKFN